MKSPEASCSRGRPREFCVDKALDAALEVFWEHGYEGTSLTALTAAMGISRPSLYAAFGDKQTLFRRAMDRYAERSGPALAAADAEPTARGFVEKILRGTVDGLGGKNRPAGCFLVQTALTCGEQAEPVRLELIDRRKAIEAVFRRRIDRGAKAGELPPETSSADLAGFYTTVLHGMAIRSADGADRPALHRIVDAALRAWPDTPASKSRTLHRPMKRK